MPLRLGRPDIARHAHRFDVAPAASGLSVTFLGVSTLLVDDGTSAVMIDGFFSRPSLPRTLLSRLRPEETRIDAALERIGFGRGGRRLDALAAVHSHFDHAMDAGVVAGRTGALLLGGSSTANVGRGAGLPEDRIRVVTTGEGVAVGAYELTFVASEHCPPDRFPGTIDAPVVPPVKVGAYKCGEAWSIHLRHREGRTLLVQGSAGFVPGSIAHWSADVAYLGVGQLGVLDDAYRADYWEHTVRAVGARHAVLTHWDDFFRGLDRPLRALPYLGDDLDVSIAHLDRLAARDGVRISLPTLWRREDPWAVPGTTGEAS